MLLRKTILRKILLGASFSLALGFSASVSARTFKTNTGSKSFEFKLARQFIPSTRVSSTDDSYQSKKLIKLEAGTTPFYVGGSVALKLRSNEDLSSLESYLANYQFAEAGRNLASDIAAGLQVEIQKTLPEINFAVVRISNEKNLNYHDVNELSNHLECLVKLNEDLGALDYVTSSEIDFTHEYKFNASVGDQLNRFVPNDGEFINQWYLNNDRQNPGAVNDADIDAPEAWTITKGAGIKVAVLDTGFDTSHPDLQDNIFAQQDFFSNDGDASNDVDAETHGTAVAGLVAAIQDNNFGISGVAPEAQLILARIASASRFTEDSNIAQAFLFAVAQGADVISNSYELHDPSGIFDLSRSLTDAIDFAVNQGRNGAGSAVVFAAGNRASDASNNDFAVLPGVIVVGASDDRENRPSYSNFGSLVSVVAPSNGDARPAVTSLAVNGGIRPDFSGTSASAPIASGVLALIFATKPSLSGAQAKSILESSADKVGPNPYSNGRNNSHGFGRVNAANAVIAAGDGSIPTTQVDEFLDIDLDQVSFGNAQTLLSLDANDLDLNSSLNTQDVFFKRLRRPNKTLNENKRLRRNKNNFRNRRIRRSKRRREISLTLNDSQLLLSNVQNFTSVVFTPEDQILRSQVFSMTRDPLTNEVELLVRFRLKRRAREGVGALVILDEANNPVFAAELSFRQGS